MRRGKRLIFATAGLVGMACLVYVALRPSSNSDGPSAAPKAQDATPTAVRTVTVQRGVISQQITATGDILAAATVDVFPKVEGYLYELRVEEGDSVQTGQVIARMADDDLTAEAAHAAAQADALRAEWAEMQAGARPEEIAQAMNRIDDTKAELANAEWTMARMRAMVEHGLQSPQELEDARRKVTQARAAHNTAQKQLALLRAGARAEERQALQARLQAAQQMLRLTRVKLQYATIVAPMDGIVGRRHVDPGAYITTTNANTPIVTIVAMDTVKIRVPFSERDIGKIQPDMAAHVRVDAYPENVFEGAVQRVSPIIDPASRSGEVEVKIANPKHHLKPGMFATVALILEQRQDVVVIPRDTLRQDKSGAAVFVVQDGKAQLQPVATGMQTDTRVEIVDGLDPGTEIVLVGHHGLTDEAPVQVVQAKE